MRQYYDIPKYRGLTVEEGEELDRLKAAVEFERDRSGGILDEFAALRRVDQDFSKKIRLFYVRFYLDGADDPVSSKRDRFLLDNPELLRFYPELQRTLSRQQFGSLEPEFQMAAAP